MDTKSEQLVESEQLSLCDIKTSPPKVSLFQTNDRVFGRRLTTRSVSPVEHTQISCDIRCLSPLQEIPVTGSVVQIQENERSNSRQQRPLSHLDSPFGRYDTSYSLDDALSITKSQRNDYSLRKTVSFRSSINQGSGVAEVQSAGESMLALLGRRGDSPYPTSLTDSMGTRKLVLTQEQRLNRLRKYMYMQSVHSGISKRASKNSFDYGTGVSPLPALDFYSGRSSSDGKRMTPSPSRLHLTSSMSSDGYEILYIPLTRISCGYRFSSP